VGQWDSIKEKMVWESMERGEVMQNLEGVVQGKLHVDQQSNTHVQRPKMLGDYVEENGVMHGSQFGKVAIEKFSNSSWKSAVRSPDSVGKEEGDMILRGKRKKQGE
jgi:hypothetical protein